MAAARQALAGGDPQFAAELATPLVGMDTGDEEARHLKASAFRKLGYAQKNASWRNTYLVAAMELDDQIPEAIYLHEAKKTLGSAMPGLPAATQVSLLPSRLKAEEVLDEDVGFAVRYRDGGEEFALHLRRGVLEVAQRKAVGPAFTVEATREAMGALLAGSEFDALASSGAFKVSGDAARARRVFACLERAFTHMPQVMVR